MNRTERRAEYARQDEERERSYQEFIARRATVAQAWRQYYRDCTAWQREQAFRRRMKAIETQAAEELENLTYRIAGLQKSARDRLVEVERRATAKLAEVEKTAEHTRDNLTAIASALVSEPVAKAKAKRFRQIPVRDEVTKRILYVDNVPME